MSVMFTFPDANASVLSLRKTIGSTLTSKSFSILIWTTLLESLASIMIVSSGGNWPSSGQISPIWESRGVIAVALHTEL